MPLQLFERAYLNDDLQALVISGEPSAEEMQHAWGELYSEYLQLIADSQALEMLYQLSLLNAVRSKIYRIKCIIAALSENYDQRLVKVLQDEGFPYQYKQDETLIDDLKKTLTRLKQDELEEADLSGLIEERQGEDKSDKINANYFREALVQCSTAFGYHIPYTKDIMTADFCALIKQLREKANQSRQQEEQEY